jgi:hypothetical protein
VVEPGEHLAILLEFMTESLDESLDGFFHGLRVARTASADWWEEFLRKVVSR